MCYVHVAALVAEYLRRKGASLIYFLLHSTPQLYCVHSASRFWFCFAGLLIYIVLSCTVLRHVQAGMLGVPCRDSKHWRGGGDDGGRWHAGRAFQWSMCAIDHAMNKTNQHGFSLWSDHIIRFIWFVLRYFESNVIIIFIYIHIFFFSSLKS